MMKALFVSLCLIFFISCPNMKNSTEASDSVGGYSQVFDNETGILVYFKGAGITSVRAQNPTVPFSEIKNKELLNEVTRTIDRKNRVVIYEHCGGLAWVSCDITAISFSDIISQ